MTTLDYRVPWFGIVLVEPGNREGGHQPSSCEPLLLEPDYIGFPAWWGGTSRVVWECPSVWLAHAQAVVKALPVVDV